MDKVPVGVVVDVHERIGQLGEPFEDLEAIEVLLAFPVLPDQRVQVAVLERNSAVRQQGRERVRKRRFTSQNSEMTQK